MTVTSATISASHEDSDAPADGLAYILLNLLLIQLFKLTANSRMAERLKLQLSDMISLDAFDFIPD